VEARTGGWFSHGTSEVLLSNVEQAENSSHNPKGSRLASVTYQVRQSEVIQMTKERGFIAYYLRRPMTLLEKCVELQCKNSVEWIVEDMKRCMRAHDYFKGVQHRQSLPRSWGAGDTV